MAANVSVNMTINDSNNLPSEEIEDLISQAIAKPPVEPVCTRPTRASKARAMAKIRDIHEWENCSENSKLFKKAEEAINEEFNALHPDEKCDADDDSDYSESEDDNENLSFVDSDSEPCNDLDSWSAAESEPESESSIEESEDSDDDMPTLRREPATIFEELKEITSSDPVFPAAETPTRGINDLDQTLLSDSPLPAKRKRILEDSDAE